MKNQNRYRSQSEEGGTLLLPRIHEHMRQGIRSIAEQSYILRKKGEASLQEEYNNIIQQSQALFDSGNEFITAPCIRSPSPKQRRRLEQNTDLSSLRSVMNHYTTQFKNSINLKANQQRRNTGHVKRGKINLYGALGRYHKLQEEYSLKLQLKEQLQLFKSRKEYKTDGNKKVQILNQTVTLLVVDLLEVNEKADKATVGLNLQLYQQSMLRKNLLQFFDEEIKDLVAPLIEQIKKRKSHDIPPHDNVQNRCAMIQSKQEFINLISQMQAQNFQDTLDDIIKYFFIPPLIYREQILIDLIGQINHVLESDKIEKVCSLKGEAITDFLDVTWKTKYLICFSKNQVILQKLPILEKLIENFRVNLQIDYADYEPNQINEKKFNARASLRRAVNVLKQEPERAVKQGAKPTINYFLERLKVKKDIAVENDTKDFQEKQKTVNFFEQVIDVVRNSKQGPGDDGHFLTPYEIILLQKEYPGFSNEDFISILNDFKALCMQNEYFEIKMEFDKTQKIKFKKSETFALLFFDSQPQLRKFSQERIFQIMKAAQVQLSFDLISTKLDWSKYVKLRALLVGYLSEKHIAEFLKNYFDPHDARWLKSDEVDAILQAIPTVSFPENFRFLFTSLVKNWLREMCFYNDDRLDSSIFSKATSQNSALMRYIVQWIVGLYEPDQT